MSKQNPTRKQYDVYLAQGKVLAIRYTKNSIERSKIREEIADLILKVEVIGGMTKFCDEMIKINKSLVYSTMMDWTQLSRKIKRIESLIPEGERKTPKQRLNIKKQAKKSNKKTTDEELLFSIQEGNEETVEDSQLDFFVGQLDKIEFFICSKVVLKSMSINKLMIIRELTNNITEKLDEFLNVELTYVPTEKGEESVQLQQ